MSNVIHDVRQTLEIPRWDVKDSSRQAHALCYRLILNNVTQSVQACEHRVRLVSPCTLPREIRHTMTVTLA